MICKAIVGESSSELAAYEYRKTIVAVYPLPPCILGESDCCCRS